jgi:hypothetical protein
VRLSSGIDSKQVINNLQGLRGNLYPRGVQGGVGYLAGGYGPSTSLTGWTGDGG